MEVPPSRRFRTEVNDLIVRTQPRSVATKLLLAAAPLLVAAFAHAGEPTLPDDRASAAAPRFQIRGSITELFPGIRTPMGVRVRNPNPFAIRLSKILTTVQGESTSCPANTLKVKPWTGRKRIPARTVRRVRVVVHMKSSAPLTCSGHRYRLVYRGSAAQA